MNRTTIEWLMEHHYWANGRLVDEVERLTPEQFGRDLRGSFASIQALLAHLIWAEVIWLSRITGSSAPAELDASDLPGVFAVRPLWRKQEERVRALVHRLTEAELDREIPGRAGTRPMPLREVLMHLFNHGTFHRGQVTAYLRQVGAAGVSTGLIEFARQARDV